MKFKVAITTSDGKVINQHFGRCPEFTIAEVDGNTGEWSFVEKRPVEPVCRDFSHDDEHIDRVAALLSDCPYLLTCRIGTYPSGVLQSYGITCLEAPEAVSDALERLYRYHKISL
jgi:Uncharacterized conserved protein